MNILFFPVATVNSGRVERNLNLLSILYWRRKYVSYSLPTPPPLLKRLKSLRYQLPCRRAWMYLAVTQRLLSQLWPCVSTPRGKSLKEKKKVVVLEQWLLTFYTATPLVNDVFRHNILVLIFAC